MSYSIQSDTSNQLLHLHLRPTKRFPKPCAQSLHTFVRRTKISTHEYLFPLNTRPKPSQAYLCNMAVLSLQQPEDCHISCRRSSADTVRSSPQLPSQEPAWRACSPLLRHFG